MHPSGTLPVHEIDSVVTDELIALLSRQAELCRVIGKDDPAQMDVAGTKAALTSAEIKLRPCRDIVLQMVDKVTVGDKRISININQPGLQNLLTDAHASRQSEDGSKTPYLIKRAFQLKRCGHGRKLIIGQQKADDKSQPDPSLIRTIARAHAGFEDLTSGLSYKAIATRDTIDERLVARTIRLALLAPDITKVILTGREPRRLTSEQLVRIPNLPTSWNEQRSLLGFD